jgi:hypothetical protein
MDDLDESTYTVNQIVEQYGIHPIECKTLPDGQLIRYLQVWQWSDGTYHSIAEPDHKYLECVGAGRHYIESDNMCRNCKSSKL